MIQLPQNVDNIIGKLESAGYEAYAVGGCVRDVLLGKTPHDWDITTSALPEQVKSIFPRTIDTGIEHGTVTVMIGKEGFEVTTYRVDGNYADGRHPDNVTFTRSLEEDLKRRDFTINAMAYSSSRGIVDLFHGREDLENGVIRCVGDPLERFGEDALRMMRAIRFSAQLSFSIEDKTLEAIRSLNANLKKVSAERIQVELTKTLVSDNPDFFRLYYETGLTRVFIPEFDVCMETVQNNPHHMYSVGEHTLHSLKSIRPDLILRLSMLLHDIGKPAAKTTDEAGVDHFHGHPVISAKLSEKILRRLKYDNHTLHMVMRYVEFHDRDIGETSKSMRRAMRILGGDLFPGLFEVKKADCLAQSMYQRTEKFSKLERLTQVYESVCAEGDCVELSSLAVSGKDLIDAGMKPGRELGEMLNRLLDYVVDDPEKNNRETLLELAGRLRNK